MQTNDSGHAAEGVSMNCSKCGVGSRRFWRLAHNLRGAVFCIRCVGLTPKERRAHAREFGRREARPLYQFGSYVPAIERDDELVPLWYITPKERLLWLRMAI